MLSLRTMPSIGEFLPEQRAAAPMPASKQLAMRWKKLGRIFSTPEKPPWMISHSANPTAQHVNGSCYRVYFNCRDAQNKASIASFDFDVLAPEISFNVSEQP